MDQQQAAVPPPPLSHSLQFIYEELRNHIETANASEAHMTTLTIDLQRRDDEIVEIRAALEAKETEYLELLRDFTQRLQEATAAKEQELLMSREISDAVNQRLETQLIESRREMNSLINSLQSEVDELNFKLQDEISVSNAIRRESEEIHKQLETMNDIKRKNDVLVSKVDHFTKMSEELKTQLKEQTPIVCKVEMLEADNKELKADMDVIIKDSDKKGNELLKQLKENVTLKKQADDFTSTTLRMRQKEIELEKTNTSLKRLTETLKTKNSELKSENAHLTSESNRVYADAKASDARDAENKILFAETKKKHEHMHKVFSEQQTQLSSLINKLKVVNTDMHSAKNALIQTRLWFRLTNRDIEKYILEIDSKSKQEIVVWFKEYMGVRGRIYNAISHTVSNFHIKVDITEEVVEDGAGAAARSDTD